ncbi:MAG: ribonucleotide reductase subunit alpha [Rhodoferax sp.]|uniref:ribonucleotide reductase subunit alpha n=1 Tax=Rhodoferax sp. TaxID=50421 RepID=UPI00271AB23A|nr:ribonucleotide reductase subunit alpha [Rhodoferax sp.]MDO8447470.1 ribonucleotide reductase subunit alpha [Rhodoferax sp.]
MNISSFDDLLQAARQQSEPQRLLFVFAGADLPEDSTPAQREQFLAGQGGALVPLMYVDKTPEELHTFADLVQESHQFGKEWSIVFAAALSGSGGLAPTSQAAEKPLERMVEAIKAGTLGTFIPFDRQGQPVMLG